MLFKYIDDILTTGHTITIAKNILILTSLIDEINENRGKKFAPGYLSAKKVEYEILSSIKLKELDPPTERGMYVIAKMSEDSKYEYEYHTASEFRDRYKSSSFEKIIGDYDVSQQLIIAGVIREYSENHALTANVYVFNDF
jgi:hypothetical protein